MWVVIPRMTELSGSDVVVTRMMKHVEVVSGPQVDGSSDKSV